MIFNCICQIKLHFQDWGNLYQVGVGVIFGLISVWLWFRDRNKSIKIKELADQTKVLKELLDNFIVPLFDKCVVTPGMNTYFISFYNSGGPLYNLKTDNPTYGNIDFSIEPQFHVSTGDKLNTNYLWIKEKHEDIILFKFEDKLKRKFSQELKLIEGTGYFEAPQEIKSH